jgi:RHH-type transcriptional regulator, proline utilization regulon repressor / proline dehydrogenase / delta 1-pyrroline-5-carboxylate dehydrogenase
VQRAFSLFPPDRPLGEALFRLAEAYPRTLDRVNRRALVDEFLHRAVPLLPVDFATHLVARQFVYAQTIGAALAQARRNARNSFSFDMLGEGARTAAHAQRNFRRYQEAIGAAAGSRRFGVSVKLSSIHARYDAAGFAYARRDMLERLAALCRAGVDLTIDAEEAERLPLHLELFAELSKQFPQWPGLGLAVQAYRPDVLQTLGEIVDMARRRAARLNVRLVKGAYWDAEIKRAQELGVEGYPVFTDKRETDLAYVAAAEFLLDHCALVFPQFATHNPVSAACVLALAETRPGGFEFQRLHGMGASLDAALAKEAPEVGVRVYAPVGGRRDLLAYLVRRLLENGASTSYVRQAAQVPDPDRLIEEGFEFLQPSSRQRFPLPVEIHMPERRIAKGFDLGEPSALAEMAKSVERQRRRWKAFPLLEGRVLEGGGRAVHSPALPQVEIGEVCDATPQVARAAIALAHAARRRWAGTAVEKRAAALERLAELMEASLAELMALCVWEAGKTLPDALADVREAVDFCRYYASQAKRIFSPLNLNSPVGESNVLTLHGRGVFACISPWNFPVAIFTGQVAAALAAGNTVVAKPAEQAPLTAYRIAQLILEAGIPPDVFHLVPGDGSIGQCIVEDARIAGVVFTGSTETARAIQTALAGKAGPLVPFIAETGGLNAMIVDSTALPEQVCDAVLSSAFRSAGQRCSSLRMLYVQDEAAPAVLELLRGALEALRVGDPADPSVDVGPVIDAGARDSLATYVDSLRSKFPLIAEAAPVPAAGNFVAPVAFEVRSIRDLPGERFGPVLHVARFAIEDLDSVVEDINATGYGLTMGVHTRIDSRAQRIRERSAVGNLYVNRNIIGAMVGVQPFGGEGLSGTGPKAGGPHYLARFATERVYTVNTAAAGGDLRLLTRAA